MLRVVLAILVLTGTVLAQYSQSDKELVRSVYSQSYDKQIIKSYLGSGDEKKIIAALLAVSQSRDTSLIPLFISLDYEKFGSYIAFTLGQLGESAASTEYLLDKLNTSPSYRKESFEAIGKTGSIDAFNLLLKQYTPGGAYRGISHAIANFNFRNITDTTGRAFSILSKEYLNKKYNIRSRTEALFALSRLAVPQSAPEALGQLLKERPSGEEGIWFLQYALSALRKALTVDPMARVSAFGSSLKNPVIDQIRELLKNSDWRIRTEAVKVFCYSYFESEDDLDLCFSLLYDTNPNVARQTAISLGSVLLSDQNKNRFYERIKKHLDNPESLSPVAAGELLLSFTKLYPDELHKIVNQYEHFIDKNYIYNALGQNKYWKKESIDYLMNNPPSDNLQKINYFNNLIALRMISSDAPDSADQLILKNLNSSFAPVISVISEGLDSAFIEKHKPELKTIIITCIKENLNNPDFSEAVMSLASLSARVDTQLYKETLSILSGSSLYPVQKFAAAELKTTPPEKLLNNFDALWNNAFRYKTAKVITTKGEFIIEFYPQYAPVSVGNFAYLAHTGYFSNNVFHRVVPNFVIQTGDGQGTGWGGPGYEIISEFSPLPYETAYVGMASSGKDTEGSQWFVMHSFFPHLNGRYTNFGKVIKGMEVVNTIDQIDRILNIVLR